MDYSVNEKALRTFADLMVKKIGEIEGDWQKPWFSTVGQGLPQNIDGRPYNGLNSFMLFLLQEERGYKTPVYMTFQQAKAKGLYVNKGSSSFPAMFWNFTIKDKEDNRITMEAYKALSKEERKAYAVIPYTKVYPVFNVDQTNFAEVYPDQWRTLQDKFLPKGLRDERGMFSSPELDHLIGHDAWLCPVISSFRDDAFFRPSEDKIYVPLKSQFHTGEAFYATLLHEMAHSTGTKSRLGREMNNMFGAPKYAREELIAELTAAVSCRSLGISSGIREENAKYLKNWLGFIKEEPQFLYSVLSDVGKASYMILNEVSKHELSMGEIKQEEEKAAERTDLAREGANGRSIEKPKREDGISPTFKLAVDEAMKGSFVRLSTMKDQGYSLSAKEMDLLKSSDPKVDIVARMIFKIPLDGISLSSGITPATDNKQQSTLNL